MLWSCHGSLLQIRGESDVRHPLCMNRLTDRKTIDLLILQSTCLESGCQCMSSKAVGSAYALDDRYFLFLASNPLQLPLKQAAPFGAKHEEEVMVTQSTCVSNNLDECYPC